MKLLSQQLFQTNQDLLMSIEELAVTNQRLSHINADLDNFIYTASHDLKAPILNIEGLIKVLMRRGPMLAGKDEQLNKVLSFMEDSVSRFKETILDLTDIARIQKQLEVAGELIDLNEMVEIILLDLQEQV